MSLLSSNRRISHTVLDGLVQDVSPAELIGSLIVAELAQIEYEANYYYGEQVDWRWLEITTQQEHDPDVLRIELAVSTK